MFTKKIMFFFVALFAINGLHAQKLEKKYIQNQTYTYHELISAYQKLAARSKICTLVEVGTSDVGLPIHLFVMNANGIPKNWKELQTKNNLKILVMNGIHPGESCGIDASVHWAESLLLNPQEMGDATILIMPIYNVGGSLNRGCCTRANQNGPVSQGFRGNAQNLDLNRDCMKADAQNTLAFQRILRDWKPDVFIDTHSTNGADYGYTMTMIPYNSEKWPEQLQGISREWHKNIFEEINKSFKTQHYVNVFGRSPEHGFEAFDMTSIYTGGFAGLFHTLNITLEAHMLKPYKDRVEATYAALNAVLLYSLQMKIDIKQARQSVNTYSEETYITQWQTDSSVVAKLIFEGYEAIIYKSQITGGNQLKYNREKPMTFIVDYYPTLKPTQERKIDFNYILLHKGNKKVLENLAANGVVFIEIKKDTLIDVVCQKVESINFARQPYEGHFVHSDYNVELKPIQELFFAGDIIIDINQYARNYLLEAFVSESPGSFFRWNYFDAFLQQKEHFSGYLFEETALQLLAESPELTKTFETKKREDTDFKNNSYTQLNWIYTNSRYYEKEHMRLPVFFAK